MIAKNKIVTNKNGYWIVRMYLFMSSLLVNFFKVKKKKKTTLFKHVCSELSLMVISHNIHLTLDILRYHQLQWMLSDLICYVRTFHSHHSPLQNTRRLLGGVKTSGTVTGNRGKNWPIAEWHIPNTDPRSLYWAQCPSHF